MGPIRFTLVDSVQFGHIRSYRSTWVIFGLLQFYSVYSIHFGLTRSIFVLIGPFYLLWPYSVLFNPVRYNSVHSVHFGLIRSYSIHFFSLQSTLLQFGPFRSYLVLCLLWPYSVLFNPLRSILVLCGPFGFIRSYLVLFIPFGPIQSIRSYSVHFGLLGPFGPARSFSVHSVHLVILGPFGPF